MKYTSFITLIVALFLVIVGWFAPLSLYLTPKSGVGYWLGIVGASMMGLLFVYSLHKRVKFLNFFSAAKVMNFHILLGIFGPILILYHSCYKMGAVNSNVALWSMLTVSISGFIGKFLYLRTGWEVPFKWWHLFHIPFVGLLVMATIVHIIAVNIY